MKVVYTYVQNVSVLSLLLLKKILGNLVQSFMYVLNHVIFHTKWGSLQFN